MYNSSDEQPTKATELERLLSICYDNNTTLYTIKNRLTDLQVKLIGSFPEICKDSATISPAPNGLIEKLKEGFKLNSDYLSEIHGILNTIEPVI